MTSRTELPRAPYRGIESFRFVDAPIFFARDDETRKLLRYATIYRGVLLYGDSGAGKSSLINAGFIPAALDEKFVPHRLRMQPRHGEEIIIEGIQTSFVGKLRYLPRVLEGKREAGGRIVLSARELQEQLNNLNGRQRLLLILDQFEELVTLFEETRRGNDLREALEIQEDILDLLVNVLQDNSVRVKLLFVFREDYLAKLTKLFTRCPNLPDQFLRLTPPRTSALLRIVRGPFRDASLRRHFGREISEQFANKLAESISERAEGGVLNLWEVQIACLQLWQSQHPDDDFKKRGVQGLLEDFLDSAIDALRKQNLASPAVALLAQLVTASGTRNIVSGEELIGRVHSEDKISKEVLEEALEALEVQTKLVRREQRHGTHFYEIVSEFLVPWITQQKTKSLLQASAREQGRLSQSDSSPSGNEEHISMLKKGVEAWNQWRAEHPEIRPNLNSIGLSRVDLSEGNFEGAELRGAGLKELAMGRANLRHADLSGANLERADLSMADLSGAALRKAVLRGSSLEYANLRGCLLDQAVLRDANLRAADLTGAELTGADLRGALLREASLVKADLREADLSLANLQSANLRYANLTDTNLRGAMVTNCSAYGISAWNLTMDGAVQENILISGPDQPALVVDNLEVAQYMYAFLNSAKIRDLINSMTSKVVLILGRFTTDRKMILDAIREDLRRRGYLPVLFDFEKPASRDLTETISTLAHMARFVIADMTDARSLALELQAIVPNLPSVPIQPILLASQQDYGMYEQFRRYNWVLEPYVYTNAEALRASIDKRVILPLEKKFKELTRQSTSDHS